VTVFVVVLPQPATARARATRARPMRRTFFTPSASGVSETWRRG